MDIYNNDNNKIQILQEKYVPMVQVYPGSLNLLLYNHRKIRENSIPLKLIIKLSVNIE